MIRSRSPADSQAHSTSSPSTTIKISESYSASSTLVADAPHSGDRHSRDISNSSQRPLGPLLELLNAQNDSHKKRLYTPHGRWEFVRDVKKTKTKIIRKITSSGTCSILIMRSQFETFEALHIVKRWHHGARTDLKRIMLKELALYKAEQFLKPLQGDVVAHLIDVYVNLDGIDVAMELPHSSFWVEASPNMPEVLKVLVIDAYAKIHSRGVLHGSVELRHMLISADGKVTIVDFTQSRVLDPKPELGLTKAEPEEFDMELRKVMYKLDYRNARVTETSRHLMSQLTHVRNSWSERLAQALYIAGVPMPEDKTLLPVPSVGDWNISWSTGWDRQSRRFELPGQTSQELDIAWKGFNCMVDGLQRDYWTRVFKATFGQRGPSEIKEEPEISGLRQSVKRKAEDLPDDNPPSKRSRPAPTTTVSEAPQLSMGSAISLPASSSTAPCSSSPSSGRLSIFGWPPDGTPASGVSFETNTSSLHCLLPSTQRLTPDSSIPTVPPIYGRSSYVIEEVSGSDLLPAASSICPHKEPIARDYVNQTYNGARGYYVPYPPLETRASINRVLAVRAENAARCVGSGLPYRFQQSRLELAQAGSGIGSSSLSSYSIGEMSRKRKKVFDMEQTGRPEKKPRQEILDVSDGPGPSVGLAPIFLDIREKRFISEAEYRERRENQKGKGKGKGKQTVKRPRGILKPTRPVKTFSQNKEEWPEVPEAAYSPKMGPLDLPINSLDFRPVLGGVVDRRLDLLHPRRLQAQVTEIDEGQGESKGSTSEAPILSIQGGSVAPAGDLLDERLASFIDQIIATVCREDWVDPKSEESRVGDYSHRTAVAIANVVHSESSGEGAPASRALETLCRSNIFKQSRRSKRHGDTTSDPSSSQSSGRQQPQGSPKFIQGTVQPFEYQLVELGGVVLPVRPQPLPQPQPQTRLEDYSDTKMSDAEEEQEVELMLLDMANISS